jgi:hypothetical protein
MKTAFSCSIWIGFFVLLGCASTPVDISGLSREADLDQYVGRKIAFTGKYRNTKELTISNGKVSFEVHRTGGFQFSEDVTVTGVLEKAVIPLMPQQNPPIQMMRPGVHYFIQ